SEVWLLDAESPSAAPVRVATRTVGVEYDVSHHGESLIMRTNAGGAEDYTLASMPLSALGADEARNSWRELLPPQAGRLRLGYHLFRNHLVVIERVDGLPQLVIYDLSDAQLTRERKVSFSEEVYSLGLVGAREFDTQVFRFVYSSMTTPQRTYDYDMSSGERVLRKEQILPSGHDPARYVAKRLMISASDGEEVPVSILHRADVPLDGSAPCLLYGYGAYGHAMPAGFSLTRLSLVDRGVIFAIAHVRGGMDRGYRWYRDGKLQKKRNTFSDFAAAARALGDRRLVDASRIAAMGGSAGGMLMGVLANEHSELFSAIVADVPFVDVLNTMLDETLPLTPPEWPEWGDPIRDASAFEYIRGYSPYDNVREGPYPHLLVLAGLSDPRVTYWEPAKWVARLRARKTDDRLLLLKTNMEAGHGGAAVRFDALEEVAFEQSFLLHVLGAM
ncbi:MAG: prolyl oligopeptidase family serine peptidase, partial [Myxococcota bacterium]